MKPDIEYEYVEIVSRAFSADEFWHIKLTNAWISDTLASATKASATREGRE